MTEYHKLGMDYSRLILIMVNVCSATCTNPLYSTYILDFPTDASLHKGKYEFCKCFVAGQFQNCTIIVSSQDFVFITIQTVVFGFGQPVEL